MNVGRWSAFILIPIILLLERFSYYGLRNVLFQDMLSVHSLAPEDVRSHVKLVSWMIALTPPLGGMLAIALRPRWTLVIGLFVAAIGYGLTFLLGSTSLAAFGVLAIGMGLFRPAVFAALADAARDPRESMRNTAFLVTYAALNVGAILGPAVGQLMRREAEILPFTLLSIAGTLLLTLAGMLSLGVALGPRLDEEQEPADPPFTGRGELGSVLVMSLLVAPTITLDLASSLQYEPILRSGTDTFWLWYVNPVAVVVVALFLAALCGLAAVSHVRVPALWAVAAGMVIHSLGCFPLLIASGDEEIARAGAYLSMVLMAVAEPLLFALAWSRMTAGTHPRSTTLVMSIWLTLSGAMTLGLQEVAGAASAATGTRSLTVVLLAAIAVIGLLMAVAAGLLQWFAAEKLWGSTRPPVEDDGSG